MQTSQTQAQLPIVAKLGFSQIFSRRNWPKLGKVWIPRVREGLKKSMSFILPLSNLSLVIRSRTWRFENETRQDVHHVFLNMKLTYPCMLLSNDGAQCISFDQLCTQIYIWSIGDNVKVGNRSVVNDRVESALWHSETWLLFHSLVLRLNVMKTCVVWALVTEELQSKRLKWNKQRAKFKVQSVLSKTYLFVVEQMNYTGFRSIEGNCQQWRKARSVPHTKTWSNRAPLRKKIMKNWDSFSCRS